MTNFQNLSQTISYPVVPVRDAHVLPGTENVLLVARAKSLAALQSAQTRGGKVIVALQKSANTDDPNVEDLHTFAVVAAVERVSANDKQEVTVLFRGLEKVVLTSQVFDNPHLEAMAVTIAESVEDDEKTQALVRLINANLRKAVNLGKSLDLVFLVNIFNNASAVAFSYQVAMALDISPLDRQALLEESDVHKRLEVELEALNKEITVLELEQKISASTSKKFDEHVRESFLREKKKAIERELGEEEEGKEEEEELKAYRRKIREAKMPKEAEEKALKELKRLGKMSQYNPEGSYLRTYLDLLVELPWNVREEGDLDIKNAEKILDADHFGLKKVKERVLEFLAVKKLELIKDAEILAKAKNRNQKRKAEEEIEEKKKEKQPSILCFVGPPGVGKTSLGKSIARSLGRKFAKISLGGLKDEAEIRGHRRTYVGALPGRIIQQIQKVGTKNPVFMLDEIDKVGNDYRGDPAAALLEILDPQQNSAFSDHYLEVPFDLSDVFFITTANILDSIPEALLDRFEVIHFPGYTEDEKFAIAKNYIIGKQREAHSLSEDEVEVAEDAIREAIRFYTREAGVRNLERQVATLMRKVAREIVEETGDGEEPMKKKKTTKKQTIKKHIVKEADIRKYLGVRKYSSQMIEEKDTVGIFTGLAWTQAGGDILFIEVTTMPGKGHLTLTGNLGDVMKESCQAALSYVRSRYAKFGLEKDFYHKLDIHVHVPDGAVPKDGPSAGLAITTAMISALTKVPCRRDVAMTGEITLRGRALEIGGLKEKVIAAHRAGIRKIVIPEDNKKDLEEDVPANVKKDVEFVPVNHMDEVLPHVLKFPKGKAEFKKAKTQVKSKK